ncbi:MAG: Rieske (2Fe-2S) protein [Actinomycetia bacterium]|nr:Rieske (2Fe-2S) protein [Actinomycetes bacterium]
MNESSPTVGRRTVLRGAAIAGAAVAAGPVLAACGSGEPTAADPTSTPADADATPSAGASGGGGASAVVLVATADVPEGGGIILNEPQVVVTQPTAGEFVAFSSICTHAGCPVADVTNGTIDCTCHGSKYAIADGSVVAGPAPSPLPPIEVTVDGDSVVRA